MLRILNSAQGQDWDSVSMISAAISGVSGPVALNQILTAPGVDGEIQVGDEHEKKCRSQQRYPGCRDR